MPIRRTWTASQILMTASNASGALSVPYDGNSNVGVGACVQDCDVGGPRLCTMLAVVSTADTGGFGVQGLSLFDSLNDMCGRCFSFICTIRMRAGHTSASPLGVVPTAR